MPEGQAWCQLGISGGKAENSVSLQGAASLKTKNIHQGVADKTDQGGYPEKLK